VGPRPGTPAGTLISEATRHVLDAMRQHGARRLLLVSGLMVGPGKGMGPLRRLGLSLFRKMNGALYRDKLKAEELVLASNTEWIIVRPPLFGDIPPRSQFRMGMDLDVKMFSKMANRDVAAALLAALTDEKYVRKAVEVSY
jgi:nucleoside-diphosphate-sugar epimerase